MLYTTLIFYGVVFSLISLLLAPYAELLVKKILSDNAKNHLLNVHGDNRAVLEPIFLIIIACSLSWISASARSLYIEHFKPTFHIEFVEEHGTVLNKVGLEALMDNIANEEKDIYLELRLKNNKSYIGIMAEVPKPPKPGEDEYFHILPMYSGFRRSYDHHLSITTNYFDHFIEEQENGDEVNFEEFVVSIDAREIVTVRRFDPAVYFKKFEAGA